ncbi:aldo/keto reductase [Singulisphaera acidiphila]|uniref:Putative oxidoreductase of aldo/keto reductase family n=1 Tax=Singulisphaera acidiphila (strain ATCC BAA-1392 / DSM 18658 / VKM B-2454 / MOB10) TaxID=886293 RepID=L0DEY9_SINAD|nr:aldo/keto reductase [Singulisphaera acidiphila]AGA27368.1 putative oxidoreductase of aldo/keto reductase family [Singulisphaera acidiphila DSM 18658]
MEGSQGSCGGNRRRFLKTAAAAGPVLAAAGPMLAADPKAFPMITLGKTGQKVSRLGMGSSWTVEPSFVQALLASGVTYIDTAEGYENGKSERTIGAVLQRTGKRKDVFLVTKTHAPRKISGDFNASAFFEKKAKESLERLQTDYIDSYFMHGLTGSQIPMLSDSAVKGAFEQLKAKGTIRYAGLSCHDAQLVEIVEAAAACGWIDHIMIQYNYRTMDRDELKRAVDKASKANIGLVAMKTQGGANEFKGVGESPNLKEFIAKGFKKEQAAIKTVFADERFHAVVSEMTNRDMLRENIAATRDPITAKEARLLEEHRERTSKLYCHGCGHLCETAAHGVPVATVLRYLRYYEAYGKRQEARALYQALPAEARDLASSNLAAAEAACPYGLPVAQLVQIADRRMS